MADEVDLLDRDPKHINEDPVKINFVDLIAEPEGIHSFDVCWNVSFTTFTFTKIWCYRFLTAILGVPLAVLWGIFFALFSFIHIWLLVPCVRFWLLRIQGEIRCWGICIRYFYQPLYEAVGKLFSNIRVTVQKEV